MTPYRAVVIPATRASTVRSKLASVRLTRTHSPRRVSAIRPGLTSITAAMVSTRRKIYCIHWHVYKMTNRVSGFRDYVSEGGTDTYPNFWKRFSSSRLVSILSKHFFALMLLAPGKCSLIFFFRHTLTALSSGCVCDLYDRLSYYFFYMTAK